MGRSNSWAFIAETRLQFGITSIWFIVFLPPKSKRASIPSTCFVGRMIQCLWTEHLEYVVKKFSVGLPWWLSGKELACQYRRHGFDPWSGKILCAMGKLSPCATNYSLCSRAQELQLLSPRMAPHSSTLAWKIPWTEEPGGLQSMGSLRVRHDRATSLWLFTVMHWRRKWQPTPVFLPGESHGQGSLVGCRLWGRTESDTTEVT